MNHKTLNLVGAISTIIISTILLFFFYGNVLTSANETFFSHDGDGLHSTYGSYYHMKFDTCYWSTTNVSYPYGESIFYTGSQPLIVNTLKVLNSFGIDLTNNLLGILNTWLLFSIVIGAFFLYLLLKEINLPWWYSVIVAIIIVYLSPQLGRFGGHFNLSYVYFLPLYLLLLKRFFDKPSLKKSIIIGVISFFALCTHAYFFALYTFWLIFLLAYGYINEKERFGKIQSSIYHLLIQIALPYGILLLITSSYPSDRSIFPWGFFATRSFPEAVFLPIGKPYGKIFQFSYLKWEGIAYVGLVSTITTLHLLYKFFKSRKRRTKPSLVKFLNVTDNSFLNAILLGAFIALIFSFAYPFQWDLKWLLNYTGPLKQFRASGRFNWLFFYTINIIAFYLVWNYYKNKKSLIRTFILCLALLWGAYDSYLNVQNREKLINNKIPELINKENDLPTNKWLKNFNPINYQAILGLPFYHVGSEVYWIHNSENIMKYAYIISWKTGLPIIDVLSSRVPISQTMKGLALHFEPLSEFEIVNDFENKKHILLFTDNNTHLNINEKRIVNYAIPIDTNELYTAYTLPVDSLIKLNTDFRLKTITETSETVKSDTNEVFTSGNSDYIFYSYGNLKPESKSDNKTLSINVKIQNTIFDTSLFSNTNPIIISFWMSDLNKDLIPRSVFQVDTKAPNGEWEEKIKKPIFKEVKYVDNNSGWGIVEFEYKPENKNEQLRIKIWNDLVTGGDIEIDDILFRTIDTDVYYQNNLFVFKNNRYILK